MESEKKANGKKVFLLRTLWKMAEDAIEEASFPYKEKLVKQAGENLIDDAEKKSEDFENKVRDLRLAYKGVTSGEEGRKQAREIFKDIVEMRLDLAASRLVAEEAKKELDEVFSDGGDE